MHDLLQPAEIVVSRSSSVARLYVRAPGSRLKNLSQRQDLLPFACFLPVDFSLAIAIDDATGPHGAAPKTIGREVEKKCPVGASKHGRSG